MTHALRFLIIDGYSPESRANLEEAGMTLAWKLYADMLIQHQPDALYDVLLPSDPAFEFPQAQDLERYAGIIWTGCNLSINDTENRSISGQIRMAEQAYEVGVPSFGSCWGLQIAVVAAGGRVEPNPRGREMGIARKMSLTQEGIEHPMYHGKPAVFEGFISHDDMVTDMTAPCIRLAGNDYTFVQAATVTHKNGSFWAVQYHPEYNLHEMARLIVAREEKLIRYGFFRSHDDLVDLVNRMEALAVEPQRKDLRWQLAIDDDVLDDAIRQCEFVNWLNKIDLDHSRP